VFACSYGSIVSSYATVKIINSILNNEMAMCKSWYILLLPLQVVWVLNFVVSL